MGSIEIEGHGLLDINIQGSSFLGNSAATFYRGGSLTCNGSTYFGWNKIKYLGKFEKDFTGCTYMG